MPTVPQLTVSFAEAQGPEQIVPALKILLLLTVLSIAPAILISMTSFTRIVIVLSFVRQAIGAQNVPPMQLIMALSFLLTCVVMAPVAHKIDARAFEPYTSKQMDEKQAFTEASEVMQDFLVPQTRQADLKLFYEITKTPLPKTTHDVSLHLLVPAFMISELRTAFEMGFLIFLPFVLIDLIVASILTAMGMVMLPPTMLATPLKLLLFVVVDGWSLLVRSLVASFG
jgi:flagellar biosynthetic protein FliP